MIARFYILLRIAALISVFPLQAQVELNLDTLIAKAERQDYSIRMLEKELQRSTLETKISKAGRLPTISGNFWNGSTNGRYYDILLNQFTRARTYINSLGVTANWDVLNGGYAKRKIEMDQTVNKIQYLNLMKRRQEIKRTVVDLYTEILISSRLLGLTQKEIDFYTLEVDRLDELQKIKKVNVTDVAVVKLTKQKIENTKLELEYKLNTDLYNLSMIINEVLSADAIQPFANSDLLTIADSLFLACPDSLVLRKSSLSYAIKQLETRRVELNSEIRNAESKLKIKAGLGVYTGYSTNRDVYSPERNSMVLSPVLNQVSDNTYEALTLNFYLPIYDRRTKLIAKQTVLDQDVAELERDQAEKKILFKFAMAKKDLLIKQQKLAIAAAQLKEARDILDNNEDRYEAERLSKTQLLIARQRLLDQEISYYASYYNLYRAIRIFQIDYLESSTY